MKTINLDVTVGGKTGDFSGLRGPPHSLDSACLRSPRRPCLFSPLTYPHVPFLKNTSRERAGGRCIRVGLFRGRFSPSSRWNFQRVTGPRHWTPPAARRANLSTPGAVPGNSSISLSPRRLQETETQAPPPGAAPRNGLGAERSRGAGRPSPAAAPPAPGGGGSQLECRGAARRRLPPAGLRV